MNLSNFIADIDLSFIRRVRNLSCLMFIVLFTTSFSIETSERNNSNVISETALSTNPFLGEIAIFPYNFEPRDWLRCDGRLLPIAQNTALFSILGCTFGGDCVSTFGIPNLVGRIPIGKGSGPGLPLYTLGQKSGIFQKILNVNEIPNHTHTGTIKYPAKQGPGDETLPADGYPALANNDFYAETPTANIKMASVPYTTNASGNGQAFNKMPPYQAIGYYICINGIYPSSP